MRRCATTVNRLVCLKNDGIVELQSGILVARGGYTSTADALLNCSEGGTTIGTGYGRLQAAGTVALNGALRAGFAKRFLPTTDDRFTVVTAGTRTGSFASFYYISNAANSGCRIPQRRCSDACMRRSVVICR
jgi:hypothetical protein